MRKLLLLLLIFYGYKVYPQDIYSYNGVESLSLGEIDTERNKIKVHEKGQIFYRDIDALSKINELTTREYVNKISKLKLYFNGGGDEPSWEISINNKEVFIDLYNGTMLHSNIRISYDDNFHSMKFMFISEENNAFGLVRRSDNDNCGLAVTENQEIYEVVVSIAQEIYQGCLTVGQRKEN